MSADLKAKFLEFCTKPPVMTTKDLKKMFTDSKIYKAPKFSSNDTDIAFSKFKKGTTLEFAGFCSVLDQLDKEKKASRADMEAKILSTDKAVAQGPKSSTGGVDRLTDASKYTGAHKERFDESGKGKGADGRSDKAESDGYVGAYKGKDTHGKK